MQRQRHAAPRQSEAVQVFRQFAWHLAGTLTGAKAGSTRPGRKPRPSKNAAASR